MTTVEPQPATPEVAGLRARLPDYSLFPLYLIMTVSAVDFASRSVFAVVLDDVKAEFGVGDTALGVLGGAYFGLATLSSIPFGILADRWHRVRLIALGFVPWCVGMLLQGAAVSFAMLFGARMLLGSIEASNYPASQSLLGDYYPVQRRSRVFGTWRIGEVIGSSIGFAIAGAIATTFGWRSSFTAFAVLGAICAVVVLRTLPEPPRGVADALFEAEQRSAGSDVPVDVESTGPSDLSFREAFRVLIRIRTAWVMVLAAAISDFFFVGLSSWATSFFRRHHDIEAAAASGVMSFVLIAVIAGAVLGGRYSDRLIAEGRARHRINFCAACYVAGFLIYLPIPALWAMWIDIIPPSMRGRAGSVGSILRASFAASGPLLIGALSDVWDLRVAFLLVAPSLAISGLVILFARTSYERDAAAARNNAAEVARG